MVEPELAKIEMDSFFNAAKLWDLLVGKILIAFFGWNAYVSFTGLTYIEYKTLLETNIAITNE